MVYRLTVGGLVGLLLSGSVLAAGADAPATPDQGDQAAMQQRVASLQRLVEQQQRKIDDLSHRIDTAAADSPDAVRVQEIKRVVGELMADSQFRESLYPDLMQVGYDGGFYITSSDETFLLSITGMMQLRYTGLNRQTDNRRLQGRNKQDDISGFEMQYMVLDFSGYIHDPKLTYWISVIGDTDQGNTWETYYAGIHYELTERFFVSAGILDLPQGFQTLTADTNQQFVDRSLAEETFGLGSSIGIAFSGLLFDRLEYAVGIMNGVANPADSPSAEQLDTNFALAGLLIYNVLGYGVGNDETDLPYSKDPVLDVGINMAYNDDNGDEGTSFFYSIPDRIRSGRGIGGYAEVDLTGTDFFQFGTHTAFRYRGLSITAEYYLRTLDGDSKYSQWELLTARSDSQHFQGGYIQAGYFIIHRTLEVAGRMGGVWDANGDNSWEFAFGANYYPFQCHAFKVQADFTRIEEAPLDSSYGNWFQNDDINMFRVAVQAAF